MDEKPADFDLKMMPDWLKETPVRNPYADYEVREERRDRGDFRDRPRPPRTGERKGRDDKRGPRREKDFKAPRRDDDRPRTDHPPRFAPPQAAVVKIEFLPETRFVESVARQIKATRRAYPLLGLARLFLEKPERHRVRIATEAVDGQLFQLGENGPVALDRALLEKAGFDALKQDYYVEAVTQREEIKGNFSNVARCRLSGTLLGPTNHHGYQPALRRLFEERFSRRMSFPEFQREIEVVNDPAAIEAWKESARSVSSYQTLRETEPLSFENAGAAEQHFRATYLPGLVRTGTAFELPGETSRNLPDRQIASAVRSTWEKERGFPLQLMFRLRQLLGGRGVHVFKHRKRIQFATAIRPEAFKDQNFSPNIAAILQAIGNSDKCARAELAATVLAGRENDPELEKLKAALAADLHWLIDAGRVIEFDDGRLEVPPASVPEPDRKNHRVERSAAIDQPIRDADPAKEEAPHEKSGPVENDDGAEPAPPSAPSAAESKDPADQK